LINTTIVE